MSPHFSEDQIAVQESVARLALDFRSKDGRDDHSDDYWAQLKASGWLALPLPERCCGFGGSLETCGIVLEESGRCGLTTPFLSSAVVASRLIARSDSAQRHAELYASLAAGDKTAAFAHSERGAVDPSPIATTAIFENGKWRVKGEKTSIIGGSAADVFVVSAIDDTRFLMLALLDSAMDGIEIRSFDTRRGDKAATIRFDCELAESSILTRGPAARNAINTALQEASISACWEALGLMQAILQLTVEHTKARQQFGHALTHFQVVRHRLAEMSVQVEEARALLRIATLKVEQGSNDRAASAAKVKFAEAARLLSRYAVQLHGGMGVTQESTVSQLFKKLMAFDALYGTSGEHLQRYATSMFSANAFVESAVL